MNHHSHNREQEDWLNLPGLIQTEVLYYIRMIGLWHLIQGDLGEAKRRSDLRKSQEKFIGSRPVAGFQSWWCGCSFWVWSAAKPGKNPCLAAKGLLPLL